MREEYLQCEKKKKRLRETEARLEAAQDPAEAWEGTRDEVMSLKRRAAELDKEAEDADLPQFPAVRTCLISGIFSDSAPFLPSFNFRSWNSPPD
jgi:predicted Ser/Thr protein kinase